MIKSKKLIILNFSIAIISVITYLALIPHRITTEEYVSKNYNATVTTIPLSKAKIIEQVIIIVIIIMLPSIIYGIKQILNPYRKNN